MRIRERFNPRAPCGARREVEEDKKLVERFQPTRPLRGATRPDSSATECQNNFNPRAPCGARLGDLTADLARAVEHFNPRAPCGARRASFSRQLRACPFQPTRPLRGATDIRLPSPLLRGKFQPTRPLRGATAAKRHVDRHTDISTHAPLAGRDTFSTIQSAIYCYFNPRAPCGARRL